MAKGHPHFIQHAIQHKGALHQMLHVPLGETIPVSKLHEAAKAKGVLGERARFALTLRGFSHKKK